MKNKYKIFRPIDIEFTPEEFKQLLNVAHAACMYHERQLENKLICFNPKMVEEKLAAATNLYKRLIRIEKANGTLVEEEI